MSNVTYYERDVLESALIEKIRTCSKSQLAQISSFAFSTECHVHDPSILNSWFVVPDPINDPILTKYSNCEG